ncbi:MAG: alpha-2-macroglobulin family protein [Planctomycetota bacterium]
MSRQAVNKTIRWSLLYPVLALLLAVMALPLTGPQAQAQNDKPEADKPRKTLTETLGGDDRYLTHLSTDKPIYRGGETVYVRGTVLQAFTQKPIDDHKDEIEALNKQIQAINANRAINNEDRQKVRELNQRRWQLQQDNNLNPMIEIIDPKGATVVSGQTNLQDSTLGFKWEVPSDQAGGEYTIKVTYPWAGLTPAERTFDIRAYRPPRIKTQIDFLKDGYGPGDTVVATVEATRAEGGIPEGAKVTAIARVDGEEVARIQTMVRETGLAEVRFELPEEIERGEGSLTFVIEDGGVVESASKTLPILLQTVDLQLFPEGGDLVAGVPNRVYFEAKTPFGKPADIKGVILGDNPQRDQAGDPVAAEFTTTHEGRGVFAFTPKPGARYTLQVTEPSSITQVFELPTSVDNKVRMWISSSVIAADKHLDVNLSGLGEGDQGIVEVRQRERVVATQSYAFVSGRQATRHGETNGSNIGFNVRLDDKATGILTVTSYDAKGNPVAERLIYRAPKHHVNIEIIPDSAQYTPGGEVQLTIKTTDQDGKPVAAVTGVTVTDDAVLEMIETREQAPSLPAMVFLEQEVQDLADAHVYLDPNNEDAAEQLDLLLGTQGWRRFALVNMEEFLEEHGDDARRMLALRIRMVREIRKLAEARGGGEGGLFGDDQAVVEVEEAAEAIPVPAQAAAPDLVALAAPGGLDEEDAAEEIPNFENAPGFDLNDALVNEPEPAVEPEVPEAEQLGQALEAAAEREAADGLFADEDVAVRRANFQRMVFVREYAHKQPAGKPLGQRSDFTETVYWSSATKTDDNGLATISFDLSDSVTSFRVRADAFTKDGALGANSELIESVRPFYVEPKLPLELTAGDKVLLPIAMVNNTEQILGVELFLSKLGRAGTIDLDPVQLAADSRGRALHELTIGQAYGELAFNIEARAGAFSDQNNRKLRVVPKGFPIDDGSGGMLNPDSGIKQEITIPESTVPGSLSANVTVYPTPLANLTEALEAMIRDPYGCFEQTSSTTFPLVMAQQYFMSHQGVDPDLIAKAKEKLDKGYKRLIGFETEKNGYEWFGNTPPHESLTAYGLLQFNEMKDVMDVDQKMIDRTADWLLSRVDEDGSFKLDPKNLDSFGGAPQDTTDAYIVWSMLEAGYDPGKIEKSIDLVLKKATEGDDAYITALGANIAQLTERDEAKQLLDKLAAKLSDEGFVQGAATSITRSGGDALKIETTSLAILAWLRDDAYTEQVEKSILWLTERCKAGRFGSTQSTVLALKAIVEYDKARSTPKAPGSLVVLVDGKPVGEPVTFDEETRGAIHLPAIASHLTPGKHTIELKMQDGSKMPYSIAVGYFADTPSSSDECKLRIDVRMNGDMKRIEGSNKIAIPITPVVAEGETMEVIVRVHNTTKDGLPTPIAIVGIPGGLEPDFDQLKELIAVGKITAFEVIGRDVVLYWREMKPEQTIELSIRCTAAVPGVYTGPASRAYLYYTDEHKQWGEAGVAVMSQT